VIGYVVEKGVSTFKLTKRITVLAAKVAFFLFLSLFLLGLWVNSTRVRDSESTDNRMNDAPSEEASSPQDATIATDNPPVEEKSTPRAMLPEEPSGEITNSIGMKLKLIPAGEFQMGSGLSAAELAKQFGRDASSFENEYPSHPVRITKPFYLGQHEVTVEQFRRFVSDRDYETEAESDGKGSYGFDLATGEVELNLNYTWLETGFQQGDDHPVVNVSWNDAVAFCSWLSRKENMEYRLPTEAEWEYSCSSNTTTLYQHGDNQDELALEGNVADRTLAEILLKSKVTMTGGIKTKDDYATTAPVGCFRMNEFGVCDMHGNVREWCQDWFGLYPNDSVVDPTGPKSGPVSGPIRVFRGSGWHGFAMGSRSAARFGSSPDNRSNSIGFRVLRSSIK